MAASRYDDVPYAKRPFAQSHPDHLAVLATLFGMAPASIAKCRLLELGCASGGNIIPMASSLPDSRFLGIDLSARQVADAQATIKALRLTNVEIKQGDILKVTKRLGEFDYIVAHGVYSWIPDQVRDKLLRICHDNLSRNGVAYVSFNSYPGWHFRRMIREMMLYHTRQFADPSAQIAQARMFLEFLAQSAPEDSTYGLVLRDEQNLLRQNSDSYLFHDHLEDINDPVYFHEFIERAARHGLQYLAEADISSMMLGNFPQNVAETLRTISNNAIRTEQYIDFLRNRSLRQTLLCRKENSLNRTPAPECVERLHIACAAKPASQSVDFNHGKPEVFRLPNGVTLTTANPLVKAAFEQLAEHWPQSMSFDALVTVARGRLSATTGADKGAVGADVQILAAQVFEGCLNNFVVLRTREAPFVTSISDRPMVSPLARYQTLAGEPVTNQLHESGNVDPFVRQILQLLDGRNDRRAIVDHLTKLVMKGKLGASDLGTTPPEGEALRQHLASALENYLGQFARLALLVG